MNQDDFNYVSKLVFHGLLIAEHEKELRTLLETVTRILPKNVPHSHIREYGPDYNRQKEQLDKDTLSPKEQDELQQQNILTRTLISTHELGLRAASQSIIIVCDTFYRSIRDEIANLLSSLSKGEEEKAKRKHTKSLDNLPPNIQIKESISWGCGILSAGNYVRHSNEWKASARKCTKKDWGLLKRPGNALLAALPSARQKNNCLILTRLGIEPTDLLVSPVDQSVEIMSRLKLDQLDTTISNFSTWKRNALEFAKIESSKPRYWELHRKQ